jgi:hypothetical protein
VHGVLRRLGIHWKRGRNAVRSPDPNYHPKRDDIATVVAQAQTAPERVVTLYLDEVTIERQPSVSQDYVAAGRAQPRANRSWSSNAETRILATLDHCTGQVVFQRGRVTTAALVRFSSTYAQPIRRLSRSTSCSTTGRCISTRMCWWRYNPS